MFGWKNIFPTADKEKSSWGEGIIVSLAELIAEQKHSFGIMGASRKKVHTASGGSFRSPFRGRGMEFDEIREYKSGDDIRTIDWKVTAKLGKPFTKLFHEERERPLFLLVDMRPNMRFGTKVAFKSVIAAKAAALIAWSGKEVGDKIGGIVFSASKYVRLEPHRQRRRLLGFLQAITDASGDSAPKGGTSLAEALGEMRRVARMGGVVFVISDFYDFNDEAKKQLTLISAHCDVVCIYVADHLEDTPPPPGVYRVSDGSSQSITFNAGDSRWREEYQELFSLRKKNVESFCARRGAIFVEVFTDSDVPAVLRSAMRKKRRKDNGT